MQSQWLKPRGGACGSALVFAHPGLLDALRSALASPSDAQPLLSLKIIELLMLAQAAHLAAVNYAHYTHHAHW